MMSWKIERFSNNQQILVVSATILECLTLELEKQGVSHS
jgi:hypothetical protein